MPKPVLKLEGRPHVHLIVSDMKTSLDFYIRVLGFYYVRGVQEMAWLTLGDLLLTLSPGEPLAGQQNYFGWSIGAFEQLDEYYKALLARAQLLSAPPDRNEGRLYFFLYDPDGYPLVFSCDPLMQ